MLTEDYWVDGVSVPVKTWVLFFVALFLFGAIFFSHYTAINSPQSKTLTDPLNLNMYVFIQAFKKLFIITFIIISIFSLV